MKDVGRLKVKPRLSLADCFALALKRKNNAELLSDHHEFDAVVASGESGIVFIR